MSLSPRQRRRRSHCLIWRVGRIIDVTSGCQFTSGVRVLNVFRDGVLWVWRGISSNAHVGLRYWHCCSRCCCRRRLWLFQSPPGFIRPDRFRLRRCCYRCRRRRLRAGVSGHLPRLPTPRKRRPGVTPRISISGCRAIGNFRHIGVREARRRNAPPEVWRHVAATAAAVAAPTTAATAATATTGIAAGIASRLERTRFVVLFTERASMFVLFKLFFARLGIAFPHRKWGEKIRHEFEEGILVLLQSYIVAWG